MSAWNGSVLHLFFSDNAHTWNNVFSYIHETFVLRRSSEWGAKYLDCIRVTFFVILFCRSYQKGVNSEACYIMIETRQVVSYFSFQVSINSEGGKRGVYTALWFMRAHCGTCYSEVRYRNLLFLRPVGDLPLESLQGFSFSHEPSLWLQMGSDLSLHWTH